MKMSTSSIKRSESLDNENTSKHSNSEKNHLTVCGWKKHYYELKKYFI